jgi:hypothetical protein
MKIVTDFVDHLECPTVDGIIFPDGGIQTFDIKVNWNTPKSFKIKIASRTTIQILENEGNLHWNNCAVLATKVSFEYSIEVIAGEGNFGSDGFIGVLDLETRKLIWLAFFTCSNPFDKITIIGDEIHAKSTVNCIWRFRLKDPLTPFVECL